MGVRRLCVSTALMCSILACGERASPTDVDPPALAFGVAGPDVTQEEWDQAQPFFKITDKWIEPKAIDYGMSAPFHAAIRVSTQGNIVGIFIPEVRHDVLYTLRINGANSSNMISGNYFFDFTGFDYDSYIITALKCHVETHEKISAYANHFARYNAHLGPIPLHKTVGPVRNPSSGSMTDYCPPPDCPPTWEPDGDGCQSQEESPPPPPPDGGGGDGGPPPWPPCVWYEYTYWNWAYGHWVPLYRWYQCE